MRGKVKFFDANKKFGFILNPDGGKDIFFHADSVDGFPVTNDDQVEFETEETEKGLAATRVSKIDA